MIIYEKYDVIDFLKNVGGFYFVFFLKVYGVLMFVVWMIIVSIGVLVVWFFKLVWLKVFFFGEVVWF